MAVVPHLGGIKGTAANSIGWWRFFLSVIFFGLGLSFKTRSFKSQYTVVYFSVVNSAGILKFEINVIGVKTGRFQ